MAILKKHILYIFYKIINHNEDRKVNKKAEESTSEVSHRDAYCKISMSQNVIKTNPIVKRSIYHTYFCVLYFQATHFPSYWFTLAMYSTVRLKIVVKNIKFELNECCRRIVNYLWNIWKCIIFRIYLSCNYVIPIYIETHMSRVSTEL